MNVNATGPSTAVSFSASASTRSTGACPCRARRRPAPASPSQQTTVTCSATDHSNNTGQASFTVTVHDVTAPQLTVPVDQTVGATSPAGAVVTYSAQATDNVDGADHACLRARVGQHVPGEGHDAGLLHCDGRRAQCDHQDVPRHRQRLRAGADARQRHRRRGEQPERRGRHVHAAVRDRHRRRWSRGHVRTALGHDVPARRDDGQLPRDELVEPDVDVQLRRARARHDAAGARRSRSDLGDVGLAGSGDRLDCWQVPRPAGDRPRRPLSSRAIECASGVPVREDHGDVHCHRRIREQIDGIGNGRGDQVARTDVDAGRHARAPRRRIARPRATSAASRSACRDVLRSCSGALRRVTSIMSQSSARGMGRRP